MLRNLLNNDNFSKYFLNDNTYFDGIFIPNWLFVVTKAIAYGLVGLGS